MTESLQVLYFPARTCTNLLLTSFLYSSTVRYRYHNLPFVVFVFSCRGNDTVIPTFFYTDNSKDLPGEDKEVGPFCSFFFFLLHTSVFLVFLRQRAQDKRRTTKRDFQSNAYRSRGKMTDHQWGLCHEIGLLFAIP